MISVLIPVYNFDIGPLVTCLSAQIQDGKLTDAEIIILDDASHESFRLVNRRVADLPAVVYEELPQNIGRSAIRNVLAARAHNACLIFLDCDSGIENQNFLKNYIEAFEAGNRLVCGGRTYPAAPLKNEMLHWKYGKYRESQPADIRKKSDWAFQSNNFCIDRSIFQQLAFDERLKGYGHEDTLFGIGIKNLNIKILHIENPVVHLGLEDSNTFLNKTNEALHNLHQLVASHPLSSEVQESVTLLIACNTLKKKRLQYTLLTIYRGLKPLILKNLTGKRPRLMLFNLYKLGYFCTLNLKKTP